MSEIWSVFYITSIRYTSSIKFTISSIFVDKWNNLAIIKVRIASFTELKSGMQVSMVLCMFVFLKKYSNLHYLT